ncbi:hypothetical protein Q8F55_006967 [Vanrija albida]|uniref:adenine phosphoribosyltransferase n=1 Tax=Vanrija albida TaxID=181172 RepID=A0ABR3PYL8_9TREE
MSTPPPPAHRPYLQAVDRTDRSKGRYELTSFFATPGALDGLLCDMVGHFSGQLPRVDAIVGLDALGFVLAGGLAALTGKPAILLRKGGKLALSGPELASSGTFDDYAAAREGGKALEVRRDLVRRGMRLIVVDEWIETGAQMGAAVRLLESLGAEVAGIGTLHLGAGADALWAAYDVFAANRSDEVQAQYEKEDEDREGVTRPASRSG